MDDFKKHIQIIIQRLDLHEKMLSHLNEQIERHDEMFNKVIRFMQIMPEYIDERTTANIETLSQKGAAGGANGAAKTGG